MKRKAFTLIELLIVVAIIAILAAIAVPNFLEAQTRSKVSRCKADMRSAVTAIEAYYVDWNRYPFDGHNYNSGSGAHEYGFWVLPMDISTPIAYLTTCNLVDPFRVQEGGGFQLDNVRYTNWSSTFDTDFDAIQSSPINSPAAFNSYTDIFGLWRMVANGPDKVYGPSSYQAPGTTGALFSATVPYDPSNGTVSAGDIIRSQNSTDGY